ncbi:hypothetical protein D3C80_1630540 [compost metagenome]
MLIFHELEVARDQVDAVEIGLANNVADRSTLGVVIAQRRIDGLVGADVKLGLRPEKSGKRGLRIEIKCKDTIALQGEIVCKVNTGRGLGTATLEVGNGHDLEVFSLAASR